MGRTINILGVIFLFCIYESSAIYCYQCSDSGDSTSSACARGTWSLTVKRSDFQRENSSAAIRKYPGLKDCSHYLGLYGKQKYTFCKIERIYSGGNLNAYIRDCSNGSDFSADLNVTRIGPTFARADNQSTCGYSHRHLANICVQVCDSDFCNGPLSGQNGLSAEYTLSFLFVLLAVLLTRKGPLLEL